MSKSIAPLLLLLQLMGCQFYDDKAISSHYYEEIYVPLFGGHSLCVKECTSYFILRLQSEIDSWIIEGKLAQRSREEELDSANVRGADILVLGYINVTDSLQYNGSATISVYDVESRKLLKEFQNPCFKNVTRGNCDYVNCSITYSTVELGRYLRSRD